MITTISRALVLSLVIAACGGKQTPAGEPPGEPTGAQDGSATAPPPVPESPPMTAADCSAAGGQVIGDIGDGAIHRPDYRCANGTPPIGHITPDPGQPIAVEGAVCCR